MTPELKLNLIAAILDDELDVLAAYVNSLVKQRDFANIPNMPPLNAEEFAKLDTKIVDAIILYRNRVGCSLGQARILCDHVRDTYRTRNV